MLTSVPGTKRWLNEPDESAAGHDTLRIAARARTDWFVDPGTEVVTANAPALVGPAEGDFILSAHVEVEFGATFDAGALVLWRDERTWAKLCFEYSPQREPMVVSVVTRGSSDDCNSRVVDGNGVWLRVARMGPAAAFHASTDGGHWELVRHFRLDGESEVGFEAQSPTGDGCAATFSAIRFEETTLGDLRSGM
jgi:regulation of enolase protein 1 (concanavalin A-like superfamily)